MFKVEELIDERWITITFKKNEYLAKLYMEIYRSSWPDKFFRVVGV